METSKTVTREELKKWIDAGKDFVLIDVLTQMSFEQQHLPGAKHADVRQPDFLSEAEKLAPEKNKIVVVYCSNFSCQLSTTAANKLASAEYTNVYHFKGGLADWQDAGYQFEGSASKEKVPAKCSCCS